ncbi:MAG TPA: DUF4337 domain-containing protein [Caulobacteraceae bacterium]
MDAAEAADHVTETARELAHEKALEAASEVRERFRNRAALVIAMVAAVLAICELGGDDAKNRMVNSNIRASDTWAFYQAKNMRQTAYRLAGDDLKRQLASPDQPAAARAAVQADLKSYEKTAARYEDDPGKDGKKQLVAQAKTYEEARDKAGERNESFDYAQMLLQLAVVLGSVSILALSRPLLVTAVVLGCAGFALVLNGFLLLIPLGH